MFFTKIKSVTTEELQAKLKEKPVILDVREPSEFKGGHIPGAKNIPLGTIGTYKEKGPVYVICASGGRSARAVKMLTKQGVDAINVKGGMMMWKGERK